MPTCWGIHNCF